MNCHKVEPPKTEKILDHDWRHCPYILIRKALRILDATIPQRNDGRVIDILEEYMKATGPAYWLKDLPPLMRVLEILSVKHLEKPTYFAMLEKMLELCKVPPTVAKFSEAIDYFRDLEEYFSFLGYLLTFLSTKNLPKLQEIVGNSLCSTLQKDSSFPDNCVSIATRVRAIESSILPEVIAELLGLVNDVIFAAILKFCHSLLEISDESCYRLLKQDCLNNILVRLEPTWKERFPFTEPPIPRGDSTIQHYENISGVTWIFFKYLSKNEHHVIKTPKQYTLWSVKYALRYFILQPRQSVNRNNVMFIILKLLDFFPKMDFVNSGLALELVQLNIASDTYNFEYPIHSYELRPNAEDFQFRKMLLFSLLYYDFFSGIRILAEEKLVRCLLLNLSHKQKVNWDPTIHSNLNEIILNIWRLYINHQELRDEYIENNGPEIVSGLIEKNTDSSVLKAWFGFLSDCTRNNYKHILPEVVKKRIDIIMTLCEKLLNKKMLTQDDMYILEHAFYFISTILHKSTDIIPASLDLCLKYLQRYLEPLPRDHIHDPKVQISAVGLIWVNIELGDGIKKIINTGLVYVMLDILNKTVLPVKIVILGALVDLCDTGACIPHLITWRKHGKKLLPLLMEIFREESLKLGVKTGPNGEIDDLNYPIMGSQQKLEISCNCEDRKITNPSISDMHGSCRPKIYALIQLIEKHHNDITTISNETYRLYNEELSTEDQITMIVADNYLDLKIAEAWQELEMELSKKFKCFYPDKFLIQTINERNKKWILQLQIAQKECLRRKKEKEIMEEFNFYQELKDCHLQPALQAIKEIKRQARTTERMFRLSGKLTQKYEVKKTETPLPEPSSYHATYMKNINVNPVFGHEISINSKIKHEIPCVRPVSPCQCIDRNLYLDCDDVLSENSEKC